MAAVGVKSEGGGNESNSVDTRLVKLMKKMEGEDMPGLIHSLRRERRVHGQLWPAVLHL